MVLIALRYTGICPMSVCWENRYFFATVTALVIGVATI